MILLFLNLSGRRDVCDAGGTTGTIFNSSTTGGYNYRGLRLVDRFALSGGIMYVQRPYYTWQVIYKPKPGLIGPAQIDSETTILRNIFLAGTLGFGLVDDLHGIIRDVGHTLSHPDNANLSTNRSPRVVIAARVDELKMVPWCPPASQTLVFRIN